MNICNNRSDEVVVLSWCTLIQKFCQVQPQCSTQREIFLVLFLDPHRFSLVLWTDVWVKQLQCLEESAESLRERSLKFYKGCRKYT